MNDIEYRKDDGKIQPFLLTKDQKEMIDNFLSYFNDRNIMMSKDRNKVLQFHFSFLLDHLDYIDEFYHPKKFKKQVKRL